MSDNHDDTRKRIHDMRGSLSTIQLSAEMARLDEAVSQHTRGALETILAEVKKLSEQLEKLSR